METLARHSIGKLCSVCSRFCGPTSPSYSASRHRWGREVRSQQLVYGGGLNGAMAAVSPYDHRRLTATLIASHCGRQPKEADTSSAIQWRGHEDAV
jgi:hypothetical protein